MTAFTPTGPEAWKKHPSIPYVWVAGSGTSQLAIEADSAADAHARWVHHFHSEQQAQQQANARMLTKIKKHPELEITVRPVKRRLNQPRFWMPYDTLSDAVRRLSGSIVYIGAFPYWVSDLAEDKPGQYVATVSDGKGRKFHTYLDNPHVDLRSFEPQYITMNSSAAWLFRYPSRHQKQGADQQNMSIRYPGRGDSTRVQDINAVLRCLQDADNIEWSGVYETLLLKKQILSALRLSPNIAVYRKTHLDNKEVQHDTLCLAYKGRTLGELKEDTVLVPDDVIRPWIADAVTEVNCKVKHAPVSE